jgi:glutathione S-transferase
MAKLEIVGFPQSTYVRVVRMACEEKGIAYELVPHPPHAPDVAAVHPFGKIPVMRHGDLSLCESKAIATYLDRTFPGPALIPSDPRLAAVAEQWISLVNTAMDPVLIRNYLFCYIFPKTADGKPDPAAIAAVTPAVREQIGILDAAVAKTGHLAGDQFTLADINLMPILFYVQQFPEGREALAAAKNLSAYYQRHAARQSFQSTMPPPPPPRQARPS